MFQLRFGVCALVLTAAATATAAVILPSSPFSQEMPQPTEHHKMLQKSVGEYEGTMTFNGPDGQPMTLPVTEDIMARGPFFVYSEFKGEMPGMPMPFEGWSVMGYDPNTEEFTGTWMDNTSSYLTVMSGTFDEKTNTMESKWMGYEMGATELIPHRMVTVHSDEGYESTFYAGEGAAEAQIMTITMKRK